MPPSSKLLDYVNMLWLETSHSFIHRYRQKIAVLDKTIAQQSSGPSASGSPKQKGNANKNAAAPAGPVARRKLVHAFRTFLGAEEQFWAELLVRLIAVFDVQEANASIRALGIAVQQGQPASAIERALSPVLGAAPTVLETSANRSNPSATQQRIAAGKQAILLCHRALICFGDLARYRELYNESPKHGPQASNAANRQAVAQRRERNYSKAAECYHQARLLVPDNGNQPPR